jgi:ribonuclease HI
MNIRINFDGACNNQLTLPAMGIGIAVFINGEYSEKFSNFIHQESSEIEKCTSNIAEWYGCVEAMRKASALNLIFRAARPKFEIYSDSQIIANQFNERFDIKKVEFWNYFRKAKYFANKVGIKKVHWVPREKNKEADKLSKLGLKQLEGSEIN